MEKNNQMKDESTISEKNRSQPFTYSVQEYFTNEIRGRVADLSTERMMQLLKELENTEYWIAVLRYTRDRMLHSQDGLFTADPVKDPTLMARTQGILLGLSDLQNGVIQLVLETRERLRESEDLAQ